MFSAHHYFQSSRHRFCCCCCCCEMQQLLSAFRYATAIVAVGVTRLSRSSIEGEQPVLSSFFFLLFLCAYERTRTAAAAVADLLVRYSQNLVQFFLRAAVRQQVKQIMTGEPSIPISRNRNQQDRRAETDRQV